MYKRSADPQGFTLIELTVVILTIAILMGLVFTASQGALDRARKTQAKNDLTQIITAVNAYYTEYGKYPMADIKQGYDTLYGDPNGSYGNEDVFNVLRAVASGVNASDILNPRKIVFFNGSLPKDPASPRSAVATQDATGTNGSPIKTGALVDPWGDTYLVYIDGNYDGLTTSWIAYNDLTYARDSANNKCVPGGVFGECYGKDGKQGKNGDQKYQGSDDALSWQ